MKPAEWIKDNLWQIGAAVAVLYGGYLTGQLTTNARIDALQLQVDLLEAKQARDDARFGGRSEFMVCAVRNFDRLFDRHGEEAPCPMEVPE